MTKTSLLRYGSFPTTSGRPLRTRMRRVVRLGRKVTYRGRIHIISEEQARHLAPNKRVVTLCGMKLRAAPATHRDEELLNVCSLCNTPEIQNGAR